jgi:hypothetical protein
MELNKISKDKLITGLVLGIVFPFVIALGHFLYKQNESGYTLDYYLNALKTSKQTLSGLATLCLIGNGLLFGLLIQFNKSETARGVFVPTVIMSVAVLLYKLMG